MRWIAASDLETWARTKLVSRVELSKVMADLIRASATDIATMRFPSGDKGQVRGFDGHLISNTPAMNVPEGESVWEFGTNKNYKAKADEDFKKRTDETSQEKQAETSYVFVTPWTWDSSDSANKREDWIENAKANSKWRDVNFIDGSMLEVWLDNCPAVAAWHARETFRISPPDGVRSTEEFWQDFAGQFSPNLTEEVLLCGRDAVAQQLLRDLMEPSNTIQVVADSPDEAVAFAIAAMRKADPLVRLYLEARTLVVDTLASARQLVSGRPLILLLRNDATRSPGQLASIGPLLVPLGRRQATGGAMVLERPGGQAMGMAMETMGLDGNRALTLARGSGRSLRALARLIPSGRSEEPPWVKDGDGLLPLVLAGAWDARNDLDCGAVERVAGLLNKYSDLERRARGLAVEDDPPFDLEGSVWKVRAPIDAFVRMGHYLDCEQAERLRLLMLEVFGALEAQPDPDAFVSFAVPNPTGFSDWLRDGLATTFLLIAVLGEVAGINLAGESGQAWASRLLADLPGLGSDPRVLTSLHQELPLLAEAAPDPLLAALERLLEGEGELIRPVFNEEKGYLFPTYKHTGVIWALETMAWDPAYFRRAVLVLAKLASIAPEIRLANTPANSLIEILLLWNPNTNASWDAQLSAIHEIRRLFPSVGWSLIKALLPSSHGTSSPTARPRLREGGANDRPRITYRDLWERQSAIIDVAIELAAEDLDRWRALIPHIRNFPRDKRQVSLDYLDGLLEATSIEDRRALWKALREEMERHQRFASAPWALKGEDLAPLVALVAKWAPEDPLLAVSTLFDNYALDATSDLASANFRRAEALGELHLALGPEAVVRLASEARVPYLVVEAVSGTDLPDDAIEALLRSAFRADPSSTLSVGLSGIFRQRVGEDRAKAVIRELAAKESADVLSDLLQPWPDDPATWTVVRRLGPDVVEAYWTRRSPRYLRGSRRTLVQACLMLVRVGRAVEAIQSALNRLDELPTPLIMKLLEAVIPQLNTRQVSADAMTTFYVEKALELLDRRTDVTLEQISQIEYAFLPLLEHGALRPLKTHELMARDPGVYNQMLSNVFRAANEEPGEPTDDERSRAQRSYSLLTNFAVIPGQLGQHIDAERLGAWVADVRRLGLETDRFDVTMNFIGRLLAHSPNDPDDGGWPHRVVRQEIENCASIELERGAQLERYNMRGVHGKAIFEGGAQERALAAENTRWAELAAAWPRTSALLRAIAAGWEHDAKREDIVAAQRRLRS